MADSFLYNKIPDFWFQNMVTELLVVWIVGVVDFFVLWAVLPKEIKRISEKRQKADTPTEEADKNSAPESFPSEGW